MRYIKLTIECYGESNALSDLGIFSPEETTEWRECVVQIDAIMLMYPMRESGTLIIIGGVDYGFQESFAEVKRMIDEFE